MQAAALLLSFAKGVPVGGVIAMLPGPVGVLCIRRVLFEGWRPGLASGLGAASAYAGLGFLAGFGLGVVRVWILPYQDWFGLAGGAYLLYASARVLAAGPAADLEPLAGEAIAAAFTIAFGVAIRSPVTVLALAAIFVEVGIHHTATSAGIGVLVGGVFIGAALWWLVQSLIVASLPWRWHYGAQVWIRQSEGALLGLAGMALSAAACLRLAGMPF
jgi:threonine/homoserine/homoserine lactone efflux protein